MDNDKADAPIEIHHAGHPQHPITFLPRLVALYCNACKSEDKDFFYQCQICDFRIHKKCAFSPVIIHIRFHPPHALILFYSLPERFYNFTYYCEICSKRILPSDWIYQCEICRYFIHIKCIFNIEKHPTPRDELADSDKDKEEQPDEIADSDEDKEEDPDSLQLGDFEITHFSHKHPLAEIIENLEKIGGVIVCKLCGKPIADGSSYGCIKCRYFMHKACTQLKPTINHHFHTHDPLTFTHVSSLTWRYWYCDVCRLQGPYEGFCYTSSQEDKWLIFIACIACCLAEFAREAEVAAIKEEAMIKRDHKGHPQHTLTLQLRPASFNCDACNSKDEGLFYQCDSCDFWIHKTCASLGPTLNLPHHPQDPLNLVYSLPEKFYNFKYYCEFCKKYIRRNDWLYHCANCRYFAHVKCALNAEKLPTLRDGSSTSTAEQEMNNFTHFPKSYIFTDPLKLLHSGNVAQDNGDDKAESNHWSHNHPLIINDASPGNNMSDIDSSDSVEVCYACVQPISHPYYSCKDGCPFNLHKYCANLKETLKHQLHPNHSLDLVNLSGYQNHICSGCFSNCNTFVYKCESCEFYLDVNCAFLPKTIKYESHEHHLIQVFNPKTLCNACDNWFEGISYFCKDCNFQLDMYCALRSPHSLTHRYSKGHKIQLIYPPVKNHPEDFYCDICETEMHPKFPLYYCDKYKNSFHLLCLSPNYRFANVMLEGTITFYYHKHPLTYVRRKKTPRYICSVCNRDLNGHLILECRARVCSFNICLPCHSRKTE